MQLMCPSFAAPARVVHRCVGGISARAYTVLVYKSPINIISLSLNWQVEQEDVAEIFTNHLLYTRIKHRPILYSLRCYVYHYLGLSARDQQAGSRLINLVDRLNHQLVCVEEPYLRPTE